MQITERDRRLLAFAAEHRFVLAAQVAALLGVSEGDGRGASARAGRRAADLRASGSSTATPACDQITRAGLRAIGSDLPPPRAA